MSVTTVPTSNVFAETLSLLKFYPCTFLTRDEVHTYQRQLDDSIFSEDSNDFEQDMEIFRMLETTAVSLSTTDNGSFVAAAIEGSVENNGPITLVIAKNRNSNIRDQEIADEFLRMLNVDFQEALKFLVMHGRDNLNERIRTLRKSYFTELSSSVASHSFKESAGEEFRSRYTPIVLHDRKWDNESARKILENLLEFVRSVQELDNDIEASHARFVNLVFYTLMLKSSRYMAFLIQTSKDMDVDWFRELKRFWNALDQIAYFHRMEKLVRFVHRRTVTIRWANNISNTLMKSADPVACRPPSRLARQLFMDFIEPSPRYGRPPLPLDVQEERFQRLERLVERRAPSGYWDSPAQVQLSLHPEIRITLDPAMSLAPHHLIGCSTSSCLCCTLWLDAYRHLKPPVSRWWLSRFGQEIDVGWALPGEFTGIAAILPLDQIVLEDIQKELRFRIYW
ncbi:hypothetical protein C0993_012818 [Termitomyces sp. T159_Od127]|nr:hypothetical protein C0993_012818 [Termitomyces sp. T159_Od127]